MNAGDYGKSPNIEMWRRISPRSSTRTHAGRNGAPLLARTVIGLRVSICRIFSDSLTHLDSESFGPII